MSIHNTCDFSIIGCGWLGLPLAETLIDQRYSVRGSSTREEMLPILEQKGIIPDRLILNPHSSLEDCSPLFQAQTLILNIPPGRSNKDGGKTFDQTIRRVLPLIEKSPVQHLLYVSSTRVYQSEVGLVDEHQKLHPKEGYSAILLEVEKRIQNLQTKATILRLSGLIGGNRHPVKYLAGRENLSGGNAPVNLIHREDAIGLILAIIKHNAWGDTFLGTALNHPLKSEYYPEMAQKYGLAPLHYAKEPQSDYPRLDNSYTRKRLDYTFMYDDPGQMPVELE